MGATTEISWADATFNPIGGCTIASHGCNHCYAQRIAGSPRLAEHPLYKGVTTPSKNGPMFNGKLTVAPDDNPIWTWPIRWRGAKYPKAGIGQPSMIFVGDMSDLFHEDRPAAVIDKVVASIIYSKHIGQLLTKRADIMRAYFTELKKSGRWLDFPHPLFGKPNFDPAVAEYERVFSRLWLGVSTEDQERADERISVLLATPAAIRFVSYEPALGPIYFNRVRDGNPAPLGNGRWFSALTGKYTDAHAPIKPPLDWPATIDWIIYGGESGGNARFSSIHWAEDTMKQCKAAGTKFFFKQDVSLRSGKKGRASDELWACKEFPVREIQPEPNTAVEAEPPMSQPAQDQGELL